MPTLEAIDAKIERARSELRLLKADIAEFCDERARLIVCEECDDERERWVYRGDTPRAPIQWSIRAGEFAYNLRSALDHLVWQLVMVSGSSPGRHTEFPIQSHDSRNLSNFNRNLSGVSGTAKRYIRSVQPYQITERDYPSVTDRIAKGLEMLNELCNMDKHRHLAIADARWTGIPPEPVSIPSGNPYLHLSPMEKLSQDLVNGGALVETHGIRDWKHLAFPIDAFFVDLEHLDAITGRKISVSSMLDACIDSVEMVVSRLREEFS